MERIEDAPMQGQAATDDSVRSHLEQFLTWDTTPQTFNLQEAENLARILQEHWPTIAKNSLSAHKLLLLREGIVQAQLSIPPEHAYGFFSISLESIGRLTESRISTFMQMIRADVPYIPKTLATEHPTGRSLSSRESTAWMKEINDRLGIIRHHFESTKALIEWLDGVNFFLWRHQIPLAKLVATIDLADQTLHALCLEIDESLDELQTQLDRKQAFLGAAFAGGFGNRGGSISTVVVLLFLVVLVPVWVACF